jgi:predicted protein tyrosine phosphatase
MPRVLVTPLSALPECIRLHAPSHLVTLLSPEYMIETPDGVHPARHLRLGIDDIVDTCDGASPPTEQHVLDLLDFSRNWDAKAPLLVHCWAGISRSMAAAFAILCDRLGPGCEVSVARTMRAHAPHADPNRLIVRLADNVLGRGGSMVGAIEAIGRGKLAAEGVPVLLPISVGAK